MVVGILLNLSFLLSRQSRGHTSVDRSEVIIYSTAAKGLLNYKRPESYTLIEADEVGAERAMFYLNEETNAAGVSISIAKSHGKVESFMLVFDARWDNDEVELHKYHGKPNQIFYLVAISTKFYKLIAVDHCIAYDHKRKLFHKAPCKKSFEEPNMLFRMLGDIPEENLLRSKRKDHKDDKKTTESDSYMERDNDRQHSEERSDECALCCCGCPRQSLKNRQRRSRGSHGSHSRNDLLKNRLKDQDSDDDFSNSDDSDARRSGETGKFNNTRRDFTRKKILNLILLRKQRRNKLDHQINNRDNESEDIDVSLGNNQNHTSNCIVPSETDKTNTQTATQQQKKHDEDKCANNIVGLENDYNCFIEDYTKNLTNLLNAKNECSGKAIITKPDTESCNKCKITTNPKVDNGIEKDKKLEKQETLRCSGTDKIPEPVGDLTQYYRQLYNTVKSLERNTPEILLKYDKELQN